MQQEKENIQNSNSDLDYHYNKFLDYFQRAQKESLSEFKISNFKINFDQFNTIEEYKQQLIMSTLQQVSDHTQQLINDQCMKVFKKYKIQEYLRKNFINHEKNKLLKELGYENGEMDEIDTKTIFMESLLKQIKKLNSDSENFDPNIK